MKKLPFLFVVIIAFVVISCITLYFNNLSNNHDKSLIISDQENFIKSVLPKGSFLRDYQKIPNHQNTFIVIYLEKGYQFNSWDLSCPGMILGDSILGTYHLSLIRDYKLINDIVLPQAYTGNNKLELTYKKYKDGWPMEGEEKDKQVIKLLDLKDLTGDGLAYEFLFTTTGGGCGFYDSLVGAYDPDYEEVVLYSDWLPRFEPDSNGRSHYLFDCGDHGNMTRVEKEYQFNQNAKRYDVVNKVETPCN